ncbi:GreA/GreB family elongation factor [Roseimaritima ulvae]|uniref:Regulator of nucleoside diphosphate kinase n=1 Tax=Roseimaritima ulvae TaxID=980254 RepID=A0A5B9QVP3_9BACT|nr:GreA/GreB family elongation factor [Roseimaritima ulvae]QEG41969.1 Regulator of nucleoside diphosphate kinase [Roseimaritima ulvae]
MSSRIVAVTQIDLNRLQALLQQEMLLDESSGRPHWFELQDALARASTVSPDQMPPEVITMNSTFDLFDLDRQESDTYTLVYPEEAAIEEGKLSILSPLGAGIFGRQVGQLVSLRVRDRDIRKRVEKLSFQPERVGALEL